MLQSFVLIILLNTFFIVEAKPSYPKDDTIKKTTPIITTKICKVFIFPKLNWRTPFSIPKNGNKFRHVRVCKDKTVATTTETTTTEATTTTTTTAAEVILTTPSMAKTKYAQDSLQVLLKEVCIIY